jgi:hypothetical protein
MESYIIKLYQVQNEEHHFQISSNTEFNQSDKRGQTNVSI